MRHRITYRGVRRERVKEAAKRLNQPFRLLWDQSILTGDTYKPAKHVERRGQPKISTSKYMPHIGAKERARFPALKLRAAE